MLGRTLAVPLALISKVRQTVIPCCVRYAVAFGNRCILLAVTWFFNRWI
jgi:hypothetical protein